MQKSVGRSSRSFTTGYCKNNILLFTYRSIIFFFFYSVQKQKLSTSCYKWEKLLTLHSDAFLRPVFHFSGEDSTGPHTDHIVSQVELKRVEAKHFNPEKPDFHRWVRALKHQRNLQGNRTGQYVLSGTDLLKRIYQTARGQEPTHSSQTSAYVNRHDYLSLDRGALCWLWWFFGGRGVSPVYISILDMSEIEIWQPAEWKHLNLKKNRWLD